MQDFWKVAVGLAGLGAIGAFVFWSLYKQWLKLDIFQKMTKRQQFILFVLFFVFTFIFALAALVTYATIDTPLQVRARIMGVVLEVNKGIVPGDTRSLRASIRALDDIAQDQKTTTYELELINLTQQAIRGAEHARQDERHEATRLFERVIDELTRNARSTTGVEAYLLASVRIWVGNIHVRNSRWDEANAEYTMAIDLLHRQRADPERTDLLAKALYVRGRASWDSGKWGPAVRDFEKALDEYFEPRNSSFVEFAAEMANTVAWFAASREHLDPDKCLRYAQRAVELTRWSDYSQLDTLGIAYSLKGDFDRAIETANLALELCEKNGTPVEIHAIREHKKQYENNQPVHPML